MTAPDIEEFKDLSLEEMQEIQNKLQGYVENRLKAEKRKAINTIKELVQLHDLTLDEVTKALRTTAKRGKAPALFRNPDKPRQTWSGKGEAPDWYANHPNPEELRIKDE